MQRFLPAFVAVLLVVGGLAAGLFLLASRDGSSLKATTPPAATATNGPDGLPAGNVVVHYSAGTDGAAIRKLAAQLGATDAPPLRTAGQALVADHDAKTAGVVVDTGAATFSAPTASDPSVAAFVRQHLGRSSR